MPFAGAAPPPPCPVHVLCPPNAFPVALALCFLCACAVQLPDDPAFTVAEAAHQIGIPPPTAATPGMEACKLLASVATHLCVSGYKFGAPIVFTYMPPAPQTPVLRLRGLPFQASEADIRQFFGDLSINRIQLRRNQHGRPTGEAFVVFTDEAQAAKGTERDRQLIGTRYIEVVAQSWCCRGAYPALPLPTPFTGSRMFLWPVFGDLVPFWAGALLGHTLEVTARKGLCHARKASRSRIMLFVFLCFADLGRFPDRIQDRRFCPELRRFGGHHSMCGQCPEPLPLSYWLKHFGHLWRSKP